VPFPPGGPSDVSARAIADGMSKNLGQTVVVENKPGAGAIVGAQAVLGQPADGHTLMMASNVVSTGPWLYSKLPYDPLRDFRAVAGIFKSPHLVVVPPTFEGDGIQDLIRMAKAKPGRMNYASSGGGTMPHLGTELFKQVTDTRMTAIPYKGSGPALVAVMANEVPVYFDILFSAQNLVQAGKLKALGVTSLARSPKFPDVPTLDEQGVKGFELYSWFGIVTHSGVPDAVVARLNEAVNEAMKSPEFQEQLSQLGALPIGGPPSVFQDMIRTDHEKWGQTIRKAGIKLD
jgi:tripartite-type tricarboxylate transporter receptor subunit TctC